MEKSRSRMGARANFARNWQSSAAMKAALAAEKHAKKVAHGHEHAGHVGQHLQTTVEGPDMHLEETPAGANTTPLAGKVGPIMMKAVEVIEGTFIA